MAPMIAAALRDPALRRAASSAEPARAAFTVDGREYDVSFRPLAGTQGWLIGIAAWPVAAASLVPSRIATPRLRSSRVRIQGLTGRPRRSTHAPAAVDDP